MQHQVEKIFVIGPNIAAGAVQVLAIADDARAIQRGICARQIFHRAGKAREAGPGRRLGVKGSAFLTEVVLPGLEALGARIERFCLPSVVHRYLGCRLHAGFVFILDRPSTRFRHRQYLVARMLKRQVSPYRWQ
ncbi:hypothetical protein [Pseudomonas sp. R1-15]|uniref:hypothetical protein n=1 Tax=Pseudomonas sp. R1-15 TaxID=2817399 RepID=UPI003DA8231F